MAYSQPQIHGCLTLSVNRALTVERVLDFLELIRFFVGARRGMTPPWSPGLLVFLFFTSL